MLTEDNGMLTEDNGNVKGQGQGQGHIYCNRNYLWNWTNCKLCLWESKLNLRFRSRCTSVNLCWTFYFRQQQALLTDWLIEATKITTETCPQGNANVIAWKQLLAVAYRKPMQLLCPTTEGFDSPTTCWMSDKNPLKGAGQRFYNTDDPQRFSNTNDPLTSQHTEADSTCSALKYESVGIQNKLMISIQCVQRSNDVGITWLLGSS